MTNDLAKKAPGTYSKCGTTDNGHTIKIGTSYLYHSDKSAIAFCGSHGLDYQGSNIFNSNPTTYTKNISYLSWSWMPLIHTGRMQ
jgi:hypothetical protein